MPFSLLRSQTTTNRVFSLLSPGKHLSTLGHPALCRVPPPSSPPVGTTTWECAGQFLRLPSTWSVSLLRDASSPGLAPSLAFRHARLDARLFQQRPSARYCPEFAHHPHWCCTTSGGLFARAAKARCVVGFVSFVGFGTWWPWVFARFP